jgi:hypothetical protein
VAPGIPEAARHSTTHHVTAPMFDTVPDNARASGLPGSREPLAIDVKTWVLAPDAFLANHNLAVGAVDCFYGTPHKPTALRPIWQFAIDKRLIRANNARHAGNEQRG